MLACLLYGQALFGLIAVAAVIARDHPAPRQAATADLRVATAPHVLAR